ncbi:MAG TPA: ABC transporter permease [Candidatus Hydrogenedens sp.]|nr:ABC transporter permease [Candidatus Hydrogenedens sp.]
MKTNIINFLKEQIGLIVALLFLIAFFSIKSKYFFTYSTFVTIVNQIPHILLLATGMSVVLIVGGIDLSVGSVLGLSGAVLGILLTKDYSLASAIFACFFIGILCGLINGFIVIQWHIPSFIVTLGMLEAGRGLTYLFTNSITQYLGSKLDIIAEPNIMGIRFPLLLALIVVLFIHFLMIYTPWGRHCFAIGAKEETAHLSGINVRKVLLSVYILSGFLASLAGLLHCARLSSSDPNAGIGYELSAIAAAVIGGNSLSGGKGSIIGTMLGVVIIATLEVGLVQISVPEPWKRVITGMVIILAVIIDTYRGRMKLFRKKV